MSRKGIMLCYPFEEKRLKKWTAPYIVQPKLDGDRCRAIFDAEGNVTLLSSEENTIVSVPHIVDELESLRLKNIELDGELYRHGEAHEEIHGLVSRTVNLSEAAEKIQYHVFDVVYPDVPQVYRTEALRHVLSEPMTYIRRVPSGLASNVDSIMNMMNSFIEDGYEGIIVRDKAGLYVRKRSTQVMKFKPRKQDIYKIVGFEEEISIDNQPKNALGALIVQSDIDLMGKSTTFNVGSGFTREQRVRYWEERDGLIGKWVIVKYQRISRKGVPIFPIAAKIINEEEISSGDVTW